MKNYVNVEIFDFSDEIKEDCLGWITIMELCDSNLRTHLKNDDLALEQRKSIADGIQRGQDYLNSVGIRHHDEKPENIVLKNGKPKWIDFGLIEETTGRNSYREMGNARRGKRFRDRKYLRES